MEKKTKKSSSNAVPLDRAASDTGTGSTFTSTRAIVSPKPYINISVKTIEIYSWVNHPKNYENSFFYQENIIGDWEHFALLQIYDNIGRIIAMPEIPKRKYIPIYSDENTLIPDPKLLQNAPIVSYSISGIDDLKHLKWLKLINEKLEKKYFNERITLIVKKSDYSRWNDIGAVKSISSPILIKEEEAKRREVEAKRKKDDEKRKIAAEKHLQVKQQEEHKQREVHLLKEKSIPDASLIRENSWTRIEPQFEELILFKVPDKIVSDLRSRDMSVQYFFNESSIIPMNFDYYALKISKLPNIYNSEQEFFDDFRKRFSEFIYKSNSEFYPYYGGHKDIWLSSNPLGAIFEIDIKFPSPDNAAVVCSLIEQNRWRFTTLTIPDGLLTNEHPVSGHREFGYFKDYEGDLVLYIKGADVFSYNSVLATRKPKLTLPYLGDIPPDYTTAYKKAIELWTKTMEKTKKYIIENKGCARIEEKYQNVILMGEIKNHYSQQLKDIFN